MALAIILGALAGLAGFTPLLVGLRMTRKTVRAGLAGSMLVLFLALFVSFVILVMTAVCCIALDRGLGFPFVVAEVIALSTAAIAYGVASVVRK
ncbi:hypothetical protein [Adlercreutzia faecimuris]|uniref:Uncharacterized protein n=1 Tax=Adlercreutzia faecimuris TaxID=2897341 RepID=A0ABS9WFY4_9ACTN|nr:hypothetical protein [Adlercreutzia sp. JBNU-10]MCI2241685.1 hypothetical protein [Adlercreutzia sp. JBNU-10]